MSGVFRSTIASVSLDSLLDVTGFTTAAVGTSFALRRPQVGLPYEPISASSAVDLDPNGGLEVNFIDQLKIKTDETSGGSGLELSSDGLKVIPTGGGPEIITFGSDETSFRGEMGLPSRPENGGWNILASGSTTVDLVVDVPFTDEAVVRINDNTSDGIIQITKVLTPTQMANAFMFGCSIRWIGRLDVVDGNLGVFLGFRIDAVDNPNSTSDLRYGITIDDVGNLRITADGGGSVTTLNTSPDDFYNIVDIAIPPLFATATATINGRDPLAVAAVGNSGSSEIIISSGSTGGVDRITYCKNFGINIYTSGASQIIPDPLLAAGVVYNIPWGSRIYSIAGPDPLVNQLPLGGSLTVNANNVGGSLVFEPSNALEPQITFNGREEESFIIDRESLFVGTVNSVRNIGHLRPKEHMITIIAEVADQQFIPGAGQWSFGSGGDGLAQLKAGYVMNTTGRLVSISISAVNMDGSEVILEQRVDLLVNSAKTNIKIVKPAGLRVNTLKITPEIELVAGDRIGFQTAVTSFSIEPVAAHVSLLIETP